MRFVAGGQPHDPVAPLHVDGPDILRPVLAEAAVLLLGTTELAWAQFLPAMALSKFSSSPVTPRSGSPTPPPGPTSV